MPLAIFKLQQINGKTVRKILCKFSVAAQFTILDQAVGIKTWKTKAGAERWMAARPTFKSGHEADGAQIVIEDMFTGVMSA